MDSLAAWQEEYMDSGQELIRFGGISGIENFEILNFEIWKIFLKI